MLRPINQVDPGYASNPRAPCYECGMSRHNMKSYPNIKKLINKEIVHQDSINKLYQRKEENDEM